MEKNRYSKKDYIGIHVGMLEAGMGIEYDVYYERDDKLVLLCRNVELTEDHVRKFKRVTYPKSTIYIPKSQYGELVMEGIRLRGGQNGQVVFGVYEDVKRNSSQLLGDIFKKDQVSPEQVDAISETIQVQVNTIDSSLLFEGINHMRNVDEYLHTHSVNVSLLNGLMGKWLGYSEEDVNILVRIGLLHDIGKLRIPKEILDKKGALTNEEFEIIKKHPLYAHELLSRTKGMDERILKGVVQHHEKINGTGYPYGLRIDAITEFARITSVSDVYDAMVADKVYRNAVPPFQTLSELSLGKLSYLDLKYVSLFIACMMEEMKGKNVVLSDGRSAKVVFVDPSNLEFPAVQIGDEILYTTPKLYPVSLKIFE